MSIKQQLLVPIKKNLFDDFFLNRLDQKVIDDLYKRLSNDDQRFINLILRRLRLADNLFNTDASTPDKLKKRKAMEIKHYFDESAKNKPVHITYV